MAGSLKRRDSLEAPPVRPGKARPDGAEGSRHGLTRERPALPPVLRPAREASARGGPEREPARVKEKAGLPLAGGRRSPDG